ncbi:LpxL/LpxP family acyltransferase [Dyadobacter sp.]|uniref:LpxL/LpxP family acyltransferase n=1 Tax=Dyadobacter sp. TaxID=1914288 RepID=UPI003F6F3D7F
MNQDEGYLMQCYAQRLETTIRRHPELWLWSHKRWQFRLRQETPKPSQVAIFT